MVRLVFEVPNEPADVPVARECFYVTPLDHHGHEWRCFMRDPDGYLIEVGQ